MAQVLSRFGFVCLLALLVTGCASNVATDYDSQAPFATYSSYAFEPGQSERVQSLDDSRVRNAVDQAMVEEGLEKVPADEADLWIRFRFEDERKYESTGFSYGLGMFNSPFGFGLSTRPEARPVRQEKMVLEMFEPSENRVIWQGKSRQHLTENMGPETRAELIEELVENMFKQYPPQI